MGRSQSDSKYIGNIAWHPKANAKLIFPDSKTNLSIMSN